MAAAGSGRGGDAGAWGGAAAALHEIHAPQRSAWRSLRRAPSISSVSLSVAVGKKGGGAAAYIPSPLVPVGGFNRD
jgi:hypothetical protein